ncbi:uncharacterized protein LOC130678435 [Microplitis mediator]|uniref:uncharacterized protein LOC130678435 n=1 Tax=Microplitis mediator TaxID=375433 RepID=UPI002555D5F3|nr:uncharacterized protein LOC130678435 [Microplitis mediator]
MAAEIIKPSIGQKFNSFVDLETFIKNYGKQEKEVFTVFSSQTIKNHHLFRFSVDHSLKYVYVEYRCKFGKERETTAEHRRSSTYKRNCEAFIHLKLSPNKRELEIDSLNLDHLNHAQSKLCYNAIVENRKLSPSSLQKYQKLFETDGKNQLIKNVISRETNKFLSNRDIQNIKSRNKLYEKKDLLDIQHLLQHDYRCQVEIRCDEQNYFKGIYFSTEEMRRSMSLWPEIVFVDGTYQLTNLDLTLMILMVEDGNGRAEIVGAAFIAVEDADTMKWFFESFKKQNFESSKKILCFMTDKDMTERNMIREVFPNVILYLCLFHTLKTFKRTVNDKKYSLQPVEKETILKLLEGLVYSVDESDYQIKYDNFKELVPTKIVQYFNDNWHQNHSEWTKYSMIYGNFNNTTNNRLENVNGKIKEIAKRKDTLPSAIKRFFEWNISHNQETDIKLAQHILKRPIIISSNDNIYYKYANYLTDIAFKALSPHLDCYKAVTLKYCCLESQKCIISFKTTELTTTPTTCTCEFNQSMSLPCKHIFL